MWSIYILKCKDKTFYTGITNDLEKRISNHNAGIGAKYTRGRGPVKLMYVKRVRTRAKASSEEYRIKQLSKEDKLVLIQKQKYKI